jgi:hypothetical protein
VEGVASHERTFKVRAGYLLHATGDLAFWVCGPHWARIGVSSARIWPPGLSEAVQHASKKANRELIRQAVWTCQDLVKEAHEEWDRIRRIVDPAKPRDIRRKAQRETEAELAA